MDMKNNQQILIKNTCDKARSEVSELQNILFYIKTLNEKLDNMENEVSITETKALIQEKSIEVLTKSNRIGHSMSYIIDNISKDLK